MNLFEKANQRQSLTGDYDVETLSDGDNTFEITIDNDQSSKT